MVMTQQAPLLALKERIAAVNDVLNATSVLTWDSRTMMPAGGAETRGRQIATLTRMARDLLLAPETEEALEAAEAAVTTGSLYRHGVPWSIIAAFLPP
jgi:carboxypeptidase Taq